MKIPPDQNTRAEAMWRIISQNVDFRNKRVIDLGCGTGDFLWRAYVAGAEFVYAVDKIVQDRVKDEITENMKIHWVTTDLNKVSIGDGYKGQYDIAFCLSVLPYLDDVPATLKWIANDFPLCLIECQYADDGPGLPNIGGDRGMMQYLLNNGFDQAIPLGKTMVEGRFYPNGKQVYRTIWKCQV